MSGVWACYPCRDFCHHCHWASERVYYWHHTPFSDFVPVTAFLQNAFLLLSPPPHCASENPFYPLFLHSKGYFYFPFVCLKSCLSSFCELKSVTVPRVPTQPPHSCSFKWCRHEEWRLHSSLPPSTVLKTSEHVFTLVLTLEKWNIQTAYLIRLTLVSSEFICVKIKWLSTAEPQ